MTETAAYSCYLIFVIEYRITFITDSVAVGVDVSLCRIYNLACAVFSITVNAYTLVVSAVSGSCTGCDFFRLFNPYVCKRLTVCFFNGFAATDTGVSSDFSR